MKNDESLGMRKEVVVTSLICSCGIYLEEFRKTKKNMRFVEGGSEGW
jgi:hypothetical protein